MEFEKHVLIIGSGPIGTLGVLSARRAGAEEILVTDISDKALEFSNLVENLLHNHKNVVEDKILIVRNDKILNLITRLVVQKSDNLVLGYVLTFDDITSLIAAQKMGAWSDIARRIAHEIKNPLTPIQLSIDSLKEKYSDQLKDKSKSFDNYLSTINRQIKDIEKLVNEFSDFARMPSPILKKINISKVLERAVEFYKMSDKNLNLIVIKDKKQNFNINGDSDQLYRVFLNLIKNSIEAIDEKKQKDKNFQGKIVVEIDRNNEYIVIKMLDNGPGFNDINNITKPYYTTKTKGTGLGLPIVSKIINEHNGDINFLKKTSGAIIEIYLPAI